MGKRAHAPNKTFQFESVKEIAEPAHLGAKPLVFALHNLDTLDENLGLVSGRHKIPAIDWSSSI